MKSFRDYLKDKEFISEARTKSSGKKIVPKNKHELDMLIEDESVYLGDIDISHITNLSMLFHNSTRKDFSGIENWDVSHVKDMRGMFKGAKNFNEPIGNWDVSNVENMWSMFAHSKFNNDISNWDVSNVVDMGFMFYGAEFNGDISNWDVSNIKVKLDIFYDSSIEEKYKPKFKI